MKVSTGLCLSGKVDKMIVSESQVGQTDANDNTIELHISVLLSFVMWHPLSDIILSMSSENHVSPILVILNYFRKTEGLRALSDQTCKKI